MIGQTLDRYRIDAKLGQGGMGVVYKAHDTRLDRVVAIKVLPPGIMASAERAQRFVQEARAASALNHPHIVTVYDLRSDAGVDFIVMEYVEGRTLAEIIPAKGLALTPALRYATQIADALARAHEAGIVHRDLKPSNVMVTPEDRVKVLDFGVAKLLDRGVEAAATHTTPITDAGMAVGTAAYMSPEQAAGKKIDARSDIFSLGAVLYEMMTGRRPFVADSQLGILTKVLNEDPPSPSTTGAALPPDVERAVLRCLRKDPARRYQTMADLKVALEDFATDSSSGALAPSVVARPSRQWPWAWAALAGALVAIAVSWPLLRRPPAPAAPLQAVPLTAVPGVKRFPAFSPDGNHVVFTWTGPNQDNSDIYVQQVGAGTPLRVTTAEAADSAPVWSPDGRSIAFLRQMDPVQQELRIVPPLGGTERRLTEIRAGGVLRPVTMAWCPDSSCIVVTDTLGAERGHALFVVSVTTGEKRQLTQPPAAGFLADTDPAISPDGTLLAFRRDSAPFSGRLQVVSLARDMTVAGEPRAVTTVLLTAYSPQWVDNQQIVFSAKGALWRLNTSNRSAPERLPIGEDGVMPAVSRPLSNGAARLAYVRSYSDSNIWRIDTTSPGAPASAPPVIAIASTRRDNLAHLTLDGQRLAFMSDRSGESEVWAADVSGSNAVQLTSLGANPGFPRWSPDGRMVAFHSNAEDNPPGDIYLVNAEGGKVRNVTMNPNATDVFPSFSRDGQSLYFSSTRSGAPHIWKIAVSGGEPVKVSPTNGMLAVESTDGASVFYVESATTNGNGPMLQLPRTGGVPVKLADNVAANGFEAIEAGIYYIQSVAADARLQFFDFATRRSTLVASQLGAVNPGIAVSADGRSIFFSRTDAATDDLVLVENFR